MTTVSASDPPPEDSPFPENPPAAQSAPLPEPDPAASAPSSLLDGTTFRFAHSPAPFPETRPAAPPSVPPDRAASARRRRARLIDRAFHGAIVVLMLLSGAVAVWRLLWMGQ